MCEYRKTEDFWIEGNHFNGIILKLKNIHIKIYKDSVLRLLEWNHKEHIKDNYWLR